MAEAISTSGYLKDRWKLKLAALLEVATTGIYVDEDHATYRGMLLVVI